MSAAGSAIETPDRDRAYREIGRFVFEFSQLEYTLRYHVAELCRIPDENFEIATSGLDFAKLCSALLALADRRAGRKDHALKEPIARCHEINTIRLRVVHGLWVIGVGNNRVIHTSRHSMKSDVFFEKPGVLEGEADRCSQLRWDVDQAVHRIFCSLFEG
ncbi:hypothetical protein [Bradyrhizobium sp. SZCCHNRI3043]|uniref:hypothetical protein n=1 Tax=Bradyrhizobium sp. SZCCHNRI3043 TaxID=3057292 RepID=UPI0028EAB1B2|nr:hypothetical protein [Bradyrhizobium sp. SZCCHNRI3043]